MCAEIGGAFPFSERNRSNDVLIATNRGWGMGKGDMETLIVGARVCAHLLPQRQSIDRVINYENELNQLGTVKEPSRQMLFGPGCPIDAYDRRVMCIFSEWRSIVNELLVPVSAEKQLRKSNR